MLRPFRLKRTIGLEYNMDLDDTFNTKKALRDLGHFRTPKYGLTPYPYDPITAPMIGKRGGSGSALLFPDLRIHFPILSKKFPVWLLREFGAQTRSFQGLTTVQSGKMEPKSKNFPVNSLFIRETATRSPETGSQQTASTAKNQAPIAGILLFEDGGSVTGARFNTGALKSYPFNTLIIICGIPAELKKIFDLEGP